MNNFPRTHYYNLTMLVALMLVLIMVASMNFSAKRIEAAPALAPTPIANLLDNGGSAKVVDFIVKQALTASLNSARQSLGNVQYLDVQTTIDQTAVNTASVKIQYSNDNANWVDGATLVSNNAADATDMTRVPNFGLYTRFGVTLANSNPVTVTVNGMIVTR